MTTILITGGTDGIGRQVAQRLPDAELILVGRSQQKADAALEVLPNARFMQADLSLMSEACRLASELPPLDAVIHCAGVMLPKRTLTAEGIETVFAVQYLSRWLLTRELIPMLQQAEKPVVISVSAGGAFPLRLNWNNLMGEKFYHGAVALIHESIANDMQMMDYQQRVEDVQFYCYGPFWVPGTGLMAQMPGWFRWIGDVSGKFIGYTPEEAADDIVRLLHTQPEGVLFGRKLKPATPTRWKQNHLEKLRQVSESLVSQAL
jgi:NAD(P)-dependent dehydrogenase (short-subunit alcohol dehydrogenase family)